MFLRPDSSPTGSVMPVGVPWSRAPQAQGAGGRPGSLDARGPQRRVLSPGAPPPCLDLRDAGCSTPPFLPLRGPGPPAGTPVPRHSTGCVPGPAAASLPWAAGGHVGAGRALSSPGCGAGCGHRWPPRVLGQGGETCPPSVWLSPPTTRTPARPAPLRPLAPPCMQTPGDAGPQAQTTPGRVPGPRQATSAPRLHQGDCRFWVHWWGRRLDPGHC